MFTENFSFFLLLAFESFYHKFIRDVSYLEKISSYPPKSQSRKNVNFPNQDQTTKKIKNVFLILLVAEDDQMMGTPEVI